MLFTVEERMHIRNDLIAAARSDPQVIGAALVGSVAKGLEDRWSDIDLALQLSPEASAANVADRWTEQLGNKHPVADTTDVSGPDNTLFRVFLLESSLQIDLSFWSQQAFRATEDGFQLIFGTPAAPSPGGPSVERLVRMGWLYALHVRACVARGRTWQAIMMMDDLRNQIISLSSLRLGLPGYHGRGVDALPAETLAQFEESRARSTTSSELSRSARSLLRMYVEEVRLHDPAKADALAPAFAVLYETAAEDSHGG